MTSTDNAARSSNASLPEKNVSGNEQENANSVSTARPARIFRRAIDHRITRRKVIRATYVLLVSYQT